MDDYYGSRYGGSRDRYGQSNTPGTDRYGQPNGSATDRYGQPANEPPADRYGLSNGSNDRYGQSNGYGDRYGQPNGASAAGGYANGYGGGGAAPASAGYANGYGGYGTSSSTLRPGAYGSPSDGRDTSPASTYGQSRYASPMDSARDRSRSNTGAGREAMKIDDVLAYVKRHWPFMMEDKCVPVQVALQLLDNSSLGMANRAEEFKEAQQRLHLALKTVVNDHHQGFSSNLGMFHQIQNSIQASQQRVRELKESLVQAKSNLSTAKPEFQHLAMSSRNFAEMLENLHVIEQIQDVPDRLEASISDKRFLISVDILQDALKLIRRPDMEDIGAIANTKVYLSNQEHSLADILTEELHNHLYLKSPYCEDRWHSYAKMTRPNTTTDLVAEAGARQMYDFLDHLDTSTLMADDSSRNPEADSFHYIHVVVESLNKLGRLSEAVDSIVERLPVELFKVVERSNNEIQQRLPNATRNETKIETEYIQAQPLDQAQATVLKDLLDTIYAKFEAIAEAHRVFHEVVVGINKREKQDDTAALLRRSFKELWNLYQSEMRSLLHAYLTAGGTAAQRSGQGLVTDGNIFRQQREKNKKVNFKLELMDGQAEDSRPERDEVVDIWQRFVPGLVSLTEANLNSISALAANARHDISAAGHKLLVQPSVFNISYLLPQSVVFINRIKDIVPSNANIAVETLSSFLNDFLVNVFHPQLEYTITDFCSQSFVQLDAFQQEPTWAQHAQKPIFKGTLKFFEIVSSFCRMLDDLTHDQLFTQLLLTQMNVYFDTCSGWYKALVSKAKAEGDGREMKTAASLAEQPAVKSIVDRLRNEAPSKGPEIIDEEIQVLLKATERRKLAESDVLLDTKGQRQLCLLYNSMAWLTKRLRELRKISDRATDLSKRRDSSMLTLKRSLTTTITERATDGTEEVFLPLSGESAGFFDGILDGYEELTEAVLRTLHLELRCQVLFRLGASIKGSYLYTKVVEAPDEDILALSTDMLNLDRETSQHLQASEHAFIKDGISRFVDLVLTDYVSHNVLSLNTAGSDHFQLNGRVLYHNLLNIEPKADLPRSFAYFKYFDAGPSAVMAEARTGRNGFTQAELRRLLELQSSEKLESENRNSSMAARSKLEDYVAQLSTAMKGSRG